MFCSMPTATITPEPEDAAAPDDWADEHVRMLRELADLGVQLSVAFAPRALTPPDPAAVGPVSRDPGLSFSRVARAVRLTLALEARIREGAFARQDPAADDFAEQMAAARRSMEKVTRIIRTLRESEGRRLVKDIAEGDETQAEALMAEFRERLA